MPTARKLPSGKWRVRAYSHTDKDGKKIYRSFTAATKQEAEQAAAHFSGTADRFERCDITVLEAIKGYIDAKENVLSPSTIYAYRVMERNAYGDIGTIKIRRLTSERVQKFISDMTAKKSPKYVRNIYALLTSSVALYDPEITWRITLPRKEIKRAHAPSDDDIKALMELAPDWLKTCIALGAFGSLRRGEVAALQFRDLDGNILHVHADIVRGNNGSWIRKETPKTSDSFRDVPLPPQVVDLIGTGDPDAPIIPGVDSPNKITDQFTKLRNELGLTIRFHDLRHYYASISAALGIPQSYTERVGGWHPGSPIMREIYQNPIAQFEEKFAKQLVGHFGEMLSDKPPKNV